MNYLKLYPKATRLLVYFFIGILITVGIGLFFIYQTPVVQHNELSPTPVVQLTKDTNIPFKLESYVTGLSVPWSILFTSDSRMLVTERPGKIREIVNGKLNPVPLYIFTEVSQNQEEGLMGIEKDPSYESNHFLYVAVSNPVNGGYENKIIRLLDNQTDIKFNKILLDNIPSAQVHAGSRVKFGPDGKLYVTTGDATQKEKAQDKSFLGGKILRMNSDGSIPSDNPSPDSYVFVYGNRNPQGIAWNQNTHEMYETEHGPSGFDGPGGGDEVNHIIAGQNYGWPVVHHEKSKEGMKSPLAVYTPAVAPASALIYDGKVFPQFKNNLLFGGLKGEGIYRIMFDENNPEKIILKEKLSEINVGRIRDVIEGPEGYIYFTTSNTDGRGKPKTDDDKIYRLIPQ